jgi:DUF4097 and DUF4098 domain-containing protein YvlB
MHQNIMKNHKPITILALVTLALPGILSAESFTRKESREFNADSIQKVDLKIHAGNVDVSSWDQSTVAIDVELVTKASNQAEADEIIDATELTFSEEEGVLEVVIKSKGKKNSSWFGFVNNSITAKANITLKAPADMDIQLKTGAGDVSVDGLKGTSTFGTGSGEVTGSNLSGQLRATSGSGQIKLEGVSGNVSVRTGSGDVRIREIEGSLEAGTGSGNIKASGQISQFSAKTGSGGVRIESSAALVENSKVSTGSGDVKILLPQSAGFTLAAGTGSGKVTCNFDLVDPVVKKNSIKGATASGGPKIAIGSGSGNITVSHP